MPVVIDDPRLVPIREKVEAAERLSFDDGVTLYRSNDILAIGLFSAVAVLASFFPARRALLVDPMRSLRND